MADLTAKRTEAQVAKAAAEAAAQAAQEQLPALAENTEALEAQRDEAKQDLADTIEYRKMLAENEKQLANVKAGVELKLKAVAPPSMRPMPPSRSLAVNWTPPVSASAC